MLAVLLRERFYFILLHPSPCVNTDVRHRNRPRCVMGISTSAWSVLGVDCRRHQFPPPQVTCWAYAKWCGRLPGAGRMDQTGERKCRWQPVNKIDQWDPWTWSKWGLVNDLNESSEGQSNQRTRGFHWSWMTGSAHWWTTRVNAILSGRYSNVNVTDMYYRLNVIGCSRCPSNTNLAGWRHDLCFCIVHLM